MKYYVSIVNYNARNVMLDVNHNIIYETESFEEGLKVFKKWEKEIEKREWFLTGISNNMLVYSQYMVVDFRNEDDSFIKTQEIFVEEAD